MFTMKIEIKDHTEDVFPRTEMIKALDKICTDTRFTKIGEGEYILQENADSIGTMLILLSRFEQQGEWLISNIKSWFILDDEESDEPEDVLLIFTENLKNYRRIEKPKER